MIAVKCPVDRVNSPIYSSKTRAEPTIEYGFKLFLQRGFAYKNRAVL
jgi:hypothetical protein